MSMTVSYTHLDVYKRQVEILADDGDYCLVQSVLSDNPTATEQKKMLRAGDEVIVAAEDLFDGKVVR